MTAAPRTSAVWSVADRYLERLAGTDATAAGAIGAQVTSRLPQVCPDDFDDRLDAARAARAALAGAPAVDVADGDLKAALTDRLDAEILLADNGFTGRLLAPLGTPVQAIRATFDALPEANAEDWELVVGELNAVPGAFDGYRRTLVRAAERGHRVAARQVRLVTQQCRSWIEPAGIDLFGALAARAPDAMAAAARLAAERATAATAAFAGFLQQELLPAAPTTDAVGPEMYRATASAFLGVDVDPVAVAEWGWQELDRIDAEIDELARDLDPAGRRAAIAALDADPHRRLDNDAAILAWLDDSVRVAADTIDGVHADLPERAKLPECRLSTTGAGVMYYSAPDPNLARRGTVWWAREPGRPVHTWRERTTVHHEGIPGHHLQVGSALAAGTLHPWQRALCRIHGYAEGWAHHAESWAADIGLLDDPGDRLGMLLGQAWRTARIVIDSGLHLDLGIPTGRVPGAERWTPDIAVSFLRQVTGLGPQMARFEVDRYLGWPAQALAFRLGAKLFGEILDAARLDKGHTDREFHHQLFRRGPMGLGSLRRRTLGVGADTGPDGPAVAD